MINRLFTVLMISSVSYGLSQTTENANAYFDQYEYRLAYNSFKELNVQEMKEIDLLKYTYSSYVIGAFEDVYNNLDPIIENPSLDPFFHLAFAESCLALGEFEKAQFQFIKYKEVDETDLDFINMRMKAAQVMNSWTEKEHISNAIDDSNTSKGDISGFRSPFGIIHYREIGLDSAKNQLPTAENDKAELLLLKPKLNRENSKIETSILLNDTLALASINSVAFVPNSSVVFLSFSEPAHQEEEYFSPHIYKGEFDSLTNRIKKIKKWEFSGFEDSSSCAHVSINPAGTKLVFSKKHNTSHYSDIYLSERISNKWTQPSPIINVNSQWNDLFPLFQADGSMSFSSNGRSGYGNLDIYTYSFDNNQIIHLKAPVNTAMDDFNYYKDSAILGAKYTSNRFGGTGDDDIYTIIYDSLATNNVVQVIKLDSNVQKSFPLSNTKQVYHFHFDQSLPIENSNLDSSILNFALENMDSYIQLNCHTDIRGAEKYNQKLSEKRGEEIKKRLISNGVPENQITIQSLGESSPVIECTDCSEKEHAENRVVILSIKKRDQKDAL